MSVLKFCLFLLLGTVIVLPIQAGECVAKRDWKSCECLSKSGGVVCSHVRDAQDVRKVFGTLEDGGYEMAFRLENTNALGDLPANFFSSMKFQELEIDNVVLLHLGNRAETASPLSELNKTLLRMTLRNVKNLQDWEWSKIVPMLNLRSIEISDSKFVNIPTGFAKAFKSVVVLEMKFSGVRTIQNGAIPAEYLQELDLSGNLLQNFSIKAFSGVPKYLKDLDLSENRIEYLEENLLRSMPALRILELENNKLFQVTEKLFSPWHRDAGKPFELILYIHGTRTSKEDCKVVSKLASDMYTIEVNSDCEEKARAG